MALPWLSRLVWAVALAALAVGAAPADTVRIDQGEARAALRIMLQLQRNIHPADADWAALFASAGYKRLQQREASFKHPFTDQSFAAFLAQPATLARTDALQRTLNAWSSQSLEQMLSRARAYLPTGATMHATIYLLIKPKTNSFVYQLDTNPAIMLYVNPDQSADQFANTVSHELFHVGDAQNCPPAELAADEKAHFSAAQQAFLEWLSAFGEGSAVLAAAGGPAVHPHWEDPPSARAVWDKAMSTYDRDTSDLQRFFSQIADGTLTGDAIAAKGFTFFGTDQGPWYTVGYKMDVTIERTLGRERLISALCDKRSYLATYNEGAAIANRSGAALPLWPTVLAGFLSRASSQSTTIRLKAGS